MSSIPCVEFDAKALGAFYTPETIADMLAQWVVRTGEERLLEPSVGDGALIRAAIKTASRSIGREDGFRFVACDVNEAAIRELRSWLTGRHDLFSVDFLALEPAKTGLVDGIIANPPFTRNHALPPVRRKELRTRFEIEGAAGLWVHFLLHACEFLAEGGRLGAVVPASAIFTCYGRQALARICAKFGSVQIRQIDDKPVWANGAEERGAIVLAEQYGLGASPIPEPTRWTAAGGCLPDLSESHSASFRDGLARAQPFSAIATLSIGAVTGCNPLFLMSEPERIADDIHEHQVLSIVSRARHVPGLLVNRDHLRQLALNGEKTWLLAPSDLAERGAGVRRRLARISRAQRRNTVWLQKRSPWWAVDAGPDCDAIFTYMNDKGPRLVLAGDGVKCTNTLHRVVFRSGVNQTQRVAAALTLISTFGQLAAERIGRFYGGGILKFELLEARSLPMLSSAGLVDMSALSGIDAALRAGQAKDARELADQALLPAIFGNSWRVAVKEMTDELVGLRTRRHGKVRA